MEYIPHFLNSEILEENFLNVIKNIRELISTYTPSLKENFGKEKKYELIKYPYILTQVNRFGMFTNTIDYFWWLIEFGDIDTQIKEAKEDYKKGNIVSLSEAKKNLNYNGHKNP